MRNFLYFIKTNDGRFLYENNGSVGVSTLPKPLVYTPDKWLDIEIKRQRHQEYFGLQREFSVPIDFVKDGAVIVKDAYYRRGIEEVLQLIIANKRLLLEGHTYILTEDGQPILTEDGLPIEMENPGFYGYYYSALYGGEIDLSQFKHRGPKVTANIMEGGISKLLKANENTEYEIDLDDAVEVELDGIFLHEKKNFIFSELSTTGSHFPGVIYTISEGKSTGLAAFSVYAEHAESPNLATSPNYWLAASQAVQGIRLEGVLKLHFQPDANDAPCFVYIKTSKGRTLNTAAITGAGYREIVIDTTFDLEADERVFFWTDTSQWGLVIYQETTLSLNYRSRYKTTYAKALQPLTLLKKICAKMGITKVESNLLEEHKNLVVTSGDALRGFDNAVIKTSFSKAFKSFNTILSCATGIIGDELRIERKPFFVDYANPIDLGECKDIEASPAVDYVINTIKIGFPEQKYDDVNGRYEVNVTHTYTTPVTRLSKELNLVSDFRADARGIEYTRINFEGKETTDGDSDNDVFVIHVMNTITAGYLRLHRGLNPYASGIMEPESVFNLWLSPRQCLLRNGQYIRSCFYKMDSERLMLQRSDKEVTLMISEPGKPVMEEYADVLISSLGDRLFTPNLLEFNSRVPENLLELLKDNPLRSFKTRVNGVTYVGLPVEDSFKPASNDALSFKVLSAPYNNLESLIDYDGYSVDVPPPMPSGCLAKIVHVEILPEGTKYRVTVYTSGSPVAHFKYKFGLVIMPGNTFTKSLSHTWLIDPLTSGTYLLRITPVCEGGVEGEPYQTSFTSNG